MVVRITGFIFDTKDVADQQYKIYLTTDNALGLLLLPLIVIMLFAMVEEVVYVGILLIITGLLFRWFQTFYFGKKLGDFSLFHLFMYLCTLEIVPLLVLIKLLEIWL